MMNIYILMGKVFVLSKLETFISCTYLANIFQNEVLSTYKYISSWFILQIAHNIDRYYVSGHVTQTRDPAVER